MLINCIKAQTITRNLIESTDDLLKVTGTITLKLSLRIDITVDKPFEDPDGRRLLPGWERRLDGGERTLYLDHNTRTTTWNSPLLVEKT